MPVRSVWVRFPYTTLFRSWLVGIGALAIPELGPFIVAGPLMMALAGVGAGGVVGGIAGAMIGLGIPEYAAKLYERRVKIGRATSELQSPYDLVCRLLLEKK